MEKKKNESSKLRIKKTIPDLTEDNIEKVYEDHFDKIDLDKIDLDDMILAVTAADKRKIKKIGITIKTNS